MKKDSPAYILLFIIAISIVLGLGVSVVHYATQEMLARNERLYRNRILADAFTLSVEGDTPEAYERAVEQALETDTVSSEGYRTVIYRLERAGEQRVGLVFSGMGFWDRITGILVLTPSLEQITNLRFFEEKETPGLGARITEKSFTEQFQGLEIDWNAGPNEHILIGQGREGMPNRVDAITGATQTSMAVMRILNNELERFAEAYRREG
ncbi:MAG: FMN-binding protein [Chitinivibrionales bacterium]|nr:FMN-binding protein [Chitinivibrionales bacterium]